MNRLSLIFLAVSILLLGTSPSAAQVEIREKPPTFKRAPKDEEPIPVIVVADRAKMRKSPSRTAGHVGRASFLDSYYLLDTVAVGGTKYHLAGATDGSWGAPSKVVGWFDEKDVLIERRAMQEQQGIYLKGLVVNQWQDAGAGVSIEGASLLAGPGKDPSGNAYDQRGEIGLFSFYFIFKKVRDVRGTEFYLLGETPVLRHVLEPGRTLVGWVEGSQLREWSTRQAVQFDKATLALRKREGSDDGAQIFAEERELVAHIRGEEIPGGEPLEPVAVEDTSVERWNHNWPRFPLFEEKKNPQVSVAGDLYRVGFIGDQIYVDGASGASSGQIADNLERVEKLHGDIKDIDLLFVIDSTGSMRKHFSTAADAVLEIAGKVRKEFPVGDSGPNIRFSVVFYRDYVDEDGKPNPTDTYLVKRLPFTGNPANVAKFLRDEENMLCDGCGGDEPEAVFYGLEYGINTGAKESTDTVGLRAVVLMGDKGNHARDPKGRSSDRVAKAIRDQRYDFFCFHMVDESWIRRDPEYRAFRDQCTEIDRKVELSAQTRQVTSKDPAAVAANILEAARSVAKDLEKTREAMRKVSRGEAGLVDIRRQYGVRLTQRLSDMMSDRGIDPTVFVKKSVQIFEEGWVSRLDPLSGERQIETVLLIDRATLEQLMALLARLTQDPPSKKSLEGLWTKALKDMTQGEHDVDKTVEELIENHLGIPVRKKLLAKTVTEIGNLQPRELDLLYSQLNLDLHKIRGLHSEKQLEIKQRPNGRGGFDIEVREVGSRPVWWQGKAGREYAWISLDDLP